MYDQLNYTTFASLMALIINLTDSLCPPCAMKITLEIKAGRAQWISGNARLFKSVCIYKKLGRP